ncbi:MULTISPECIES: pyridoxamine 5'-phosphate oxidase family protein [unclassified Mesorhizobium]|uniref:pyridoxamine 5'-phosphate oxidase family protein n=1 Tax=unclassified Mesorhizobium TaxID=325217 RepID=UPI001CCAC1B5|nr:MULTISPECIES: pyridoxamine 5'-phosphate oxidase family protein [unclassified Mesorhizobium]MBZ9742879.1 pyridoxamine 5'-phosphate oxidase family protein [Mesorhizobium sp. CO1-1-4]MBZ9805924.1 pyridoxamine 5'-phosphate oxidase family protein [Mesorhizobium sp. ES1-6]
MTDKSLAEIAEKMRDIDVAMLSTHTQGGAIAGRPMSNNQDVEYDGSSFYFTWDKSQVVEDIERDANVSLAFKGDDGFWVAVEGKAEIIRDKAAFEEHWTDDIDEWFEQGTDTPGLAMIKIEAVRAHYWDGEDEGEVTLSS